MECPKCHSSNPDGALYCSLCYENFRPKPKTEAAGGGFAALPAAMTHIKRMWSSDDFIFGPLLARDEGIYIFIKEYKSQNAEIMKQQGGLLGMAIGTALENKTNRPKDINCQFTTKISDIIKPALPAAPNMAECRDYFMIPKHEIKELKFYGGFLTGHGFKIKTETINADIAAMSTSSGGTTGMPKKEWEKCKANLEGFLIIKGYPH